MVNEVGRVLGEGGVEKVVEFAGVEGGMTTTTTGQGCKVTMRSRLSS